jgi:hypothetical protein
MSAQSTKLELIQVATTAYPGLSVNDALYLYLQTLYSSNEGLPDLLFRYGLTQDTFIEGGMLIQSGALARNTSLYGG